MNQAKACGLAAISALAALALLGAVSASATTLCKAKETVCAAANRYPKGTTLKMKLKAKTEATFVTSFGTVKCKEASIEAHSNEESSGSSAVAIDGLIGLGPFSFCKLGETECTVIPPNLPWLILNLFLSSFPFYHVKIEEDLQGTGGPRTEVKCGAFIQCTFGVESLLLAGESGSPAALTAAGLVLKKESGALCSAEAKWSAEYEITTPSPLYVSPEP
jgi:hypothetical protein